MALPPFPCDVFISFRGPDTRHGFTGNLWKALDDKGIHTFIDDMEHVRGKEITPLLFKTIEESRIAIIVFSKNYAFSSFCLDELCKILECNKAKGLVVLPVFYEVHPFDVRWLTGTYGEAIAMHEKSFANKKERMQNWKKALCQAADLSGWHFKHGDGYEYKLIERIVEVVSTKINCFPLPVADHPVGLDSRVQEVNSLLEVGSVDRVDFVGIYGTCGIGKTTLAVAVYNSNSHHFERLYFLEKVGENSRKHGLLHLQKILLCKILGEKKIELTSVKEGISIIQHRLKQKMVLLLLDGIDNKEQLHALAGRRDWFGLGSRVIITTRDKRLLECHGIERAYEVKELKEKDASELLRWKAFKTDKVDPCYVDILNCVVTYASGVPSALEAIGSELCGKSIQEWNSVLDRYEKMHNNKDIQKILELSFGDALEKEEHSVLHIPCCFKGCELFIPWAHHGVHLKVNIEDLVKKSLIKINHGEVALHDKGREIVQCSRVWFCADIIHVSEENKEYQVGKEKCQLASNDKTMAWDPMELEYKVTYPEDQPVSNDESSHLMGSETNQRSCWWQFCLSSFITSIVSLCSPSSSLSAPSPK